MENELVDILEIIKIDEFASNDYLYKLKEPVECELTHLTKEELWIGVIIELGVHSTGKTKEEVIQNIHLGVHQKYNELLKQLNIFQSIQLKNIYQLSF